MLATIASTIAAFWVHGVGVLRVFVGCWVLECLGAPCSMSSEEVNA